MSSSFDEPSNSTPPGSQETPPPAPGAPEAPKPKGPLRRIGASVKRLTSAKQRFAMPNRQSGLKIVIATDAWRPQLNGVVRTLETLGDILKGFGNDVLYITPDQFHTVPMPTYSEIKLAILPNRKVAKLINDYQPDAIHIATEGTIGRAARRFCVRRGHPFTTSFHTRFPEYINARFGVPIDWGYSALRNFHAPGVTMMVATPSLRDELEARGFKNMKLWARGVDTEAFKPGARDLLDHLPRPIWLYVGRLAVEKSIEDFTKLDLPGTKVVIGDGPQAEELKQKYPEVVFEGPRFGDELTAYYAASDVFVRPSRPDTYRLVYVEALACGVPVAAYPVRGPSEILGGAPAGCGALDEDLKAACLRALEHADAEACRAHALNFSWEAGARQFIANLEIPGFDEEFWLRSAKMID
ncbi:MAG: glycosyltransferase family 1 protein [Pseudomonadota bacterium]